MSNRWSFLLGILSLNLLASSCSMMDSSPRGAMCRELRSQIVFNGATGNTRNSEMEKVNEPLLQRTYDNDNCDT